MTKEHVNDQQKMLEYIQAIWKLNLFIQNLLDSDKNGTFESELIEYLDEKHIEVCDQFGHIEPEKCPLLAEID